MESCKFLDTVFKHFGHRTVTSLYNKAIDLLDIIEMGEKVRDYQDNMIEEFAFISKNIARTLRQNITKQIGFALPI
jgi:hypothetical protein